MCKQVFEIKTCIITFNSSMELRKEIRKQRTKLRHQNKEMNKTGEGQTEIKETKVKGQTCLL